MNVRCKKCGGLIATHFSRPTFIAAISSTFLDDWERENGSAPGISPEQLQILGTIAHFPELLESRSVPNMFWDVFGKVFAAHPDFALAFITWYREKVRNEPPARTWFFDHYHRYDPMMSADETVVEISRVLHSAVSSAAVRKQKSDLMRIGACVVTHVCEKKRSKISHSKS